MSVDGWLMSVGISATRPFTPSAAQRVFQVQIPELLGPADATISNDGKRFVVNSLVVPHTVPSIHVVVNWQTLLNR